MEVLFFNLSLNLHSLSFSFETSGSELPSSLTSHLADLRSTAVLQSSYFVRLLCFPLCARGIHGHECRIEKTTLYCYTLDAVRLLITPQALPKSSKKLQLRLRTPPKDVLRSV